MTENRLSFAKMHGAGNDFVVLSQAPPAAPLDARWVAAICDRHRGVGADGALWMEPLQEPGLVFRMHFYNCDGGRVNLCLNGARCVARRAVDLGWCAGEFAFRTELAVIHAVVDDDRVSLSFPPPTADLAAVALPDGHPADTAHRVDTGDPHLVVEVGADGLEDAVFLESARRLRHWTAHGPGGFNVHFVHRQGPDWTIRSFERGIEGETLACGSGCVSAVLSLAPEREAVSLTTRSGDVIEVQPGPEAWTLHGPAVTVCTGEFNLEGERASKT